MLIHKNECSQISSITDKEKEIRKNRVSFMIKKKFRAMAGEKRLGVAWMLIDPIIVAAVYLFVFTVLRANTDGSSMFIGISMIRIFQTGFKSGVNSISDFTGGIKAEIVSTETMIQAMFYYRIIESVLHSIGTAVILFLVYGIDLSGLSGFVIICLFVGIISEGLGLNLALISRIFPDVKSLVNYFLMLMFFGSPALYPFSQTNGLHKTFNEFNLFTYAVEMSRYMAGIESSVAILNEKIFIIIMIILLPIAIKGYIDIERMRWRFSSW